MMFEQQLSQVIEENELKELLNDGQKHEAIFVQSMFVDGKSCRIPVIANRTISSYDDLIAFDNEVTNIVKSALSADSLITDAITSAAIYALGDLEHCNEPDVTKWTEFARLVGVAIACSECGDIRNSLGYQEELVRPFKEFLENHPLPEYKEEQEG